VKFYDDDPRLEARGQSIAMYTPYNVAFLAAFKAEIPAGARRWNNADKAWIVAPKYGKTLRRLILDHYQFNVSVPVIATVAKEETRLLKLLYLGTPKDRGGDIAVAYGWVGGGWTTSWPLPVLRAWFEPSVDGERPGDAPTLYAVLGLKRTAAGADIKAAWRKLARRWHPDMNSDPDATAQMVRVNEAYEVLSDGPKRARYDAGLKLQAAARGAAPPSSPGSWRPPYRCGLVQVRGVEEVGRFSARRILGWRDIVDAQGRILVTFWKWGDDRFSERWV
jgi:hypothetical protein